jgi:hypothetical protein
MVTATTGQAQFLDLVTKEVKSVSFYISDVVGAKFTWSQQGAAGAGSGTTVQFKNPVQIIDISILTGPTVMTGWYWSSYDTPIPSSNNLISPNLTTVQTRNFTRTAFGAGALISATQF